MHFRLFLYLIQNQSLISISQRSSSNEITSCFYRSFEKGPRIPQQNNYFPYYFLLASLNRCVEVHRTVETFGEMKLRALTISSGSIKLPISSHRVKAYIFRGNVTWFSLCNSSATQFLARRAATRFSAFNESR